VDCRAEGDYDGEEKSTNPRPSEVIGVFQMRRGEARSSGAAKQVFYVWKKCRRRRGKYLFKAAQIVRGAEFELGALVCYEVGKSWIEATRTLPRRLIFAILRREMLRWPNRRS